MISETALGMSSYCLESHHGRELLFYLLRSTNPCAGANNLFGRPAISCCHATASVLSRP